MMYRTLPLALLLVACRPDPASEAARAYVDQLSPLLQDNGLLAERILTAAAHVYNEDADAADLEARWRQEVVPVAAHLHHQAANVSAAPPWDTHHAALVEVWGTRAEAYGELADALERGHREAWDAARDRSDDIKLREETWFQELNTALAPHDLTVDQFP